MKTKNSPFGCDLRQNSFGQSNVGINLIFELPLWSNAMVESVKL